MQSNDVDISTNGGRQQSMDVMEPKSINVMEKDLYYWIKIMSSQVETIRNHRREQRNQEIVPFIQKQTSKIEVFFAQKKNKPQFLFQSDRKLRGLRE
uniref:AlNc14C146G7399 protein n=1 Tax=Albugo laibachii Nc14 TaxID=890382 RepID=F0WLL1_9STRA|nr:AlNc14C146G7399 [Albugo laibachii Nc14]|eukprot:CCA22176.1 AlNc14C146G7399 [Albugo laibachii Nc14]